MLFANEQMTSQMGALLEEGRQYWNLQKKYLGLHTAEVLTRLLSRIALVLILILVGSLVLLFGSFALAFWLGALLDSTTPPTVPQADPKNPIIVAKTTLQLNFKGCNQQNKSNTLLLLILLLVLKKTLM